MSSTANRVLEDTILEILAVVKPENDDWVVRFQVVEELRAVVRSLETLRGATVEPYGSFVSNLFAKYGDLDISIELGLANGSFISSSGKKEKQKLLKDLMRAMRKSGGWDKFNYIPQARVPILKVESNIQSISCDISIDNLQAQMKSKFLLWISEVDTRFRDMVLLVKEWAKARNINNPKAGTFNSFSLSLLVVFHFQTCVPAIFPPLKDIYPGNIAEDLKGLRANAERDISETCKANIARFRSDRHRAVNKCPLSELFTLFLAKFSQLSSSASEWGICTFTGQWEHIQSITRWLPQNYAIFVEDPFEQPANSARTVNSSQMMRISEAFQSSFNRLRSGNYDKSDILATIAQHRTCQVMLPRGPVYNADVYHQSSSQRQFRSQNARPQVAKRVVHTSGSTSTVTHYGKAQKQVVHANGSMPIGTYQGAQTQRVVHSSGSMSTGIYNEHAQKQQVVHSKGSTPTGTYHSQAQKQRVNTNGSTSTGTFYSQGPKQVVRPTGSTSTRVFYSQARKQVVRPNSSTSTSTSTGTFYSQGPKQVVSPNGSTSTGTFSSQARKQVVRPNSSTSTSTGTFYSQAPKQVVSPNGSTSTGTFSSQAQKQQEQWRPRSTR